MAHADLVEIFRCSYRFHQRKLQEYLDRLASLPEAIWELHLHHQDVLGFVNGGAAGAQRYPRPLLGGGLEFRAEYYPARRLRHLGAGRRVAPPGFEAARSGSFLDPANIEWQQRGQQLPYRRWIAGKPFHILVQPFPFGQLHSTVASAELESQDWRERGFGEFESRATHLCELAVMLGPGFLSLMNGIGAGASEPKWYHLQCLLPVSVPLEMAALRSAGPTPPPVLRIGEPHWPIPVFRVRGTVSFVARTVTRLARRWSEIAGPRATENLAAVAMDGEVVCYFVPRCREREFPDRTQFAGAIGAYESVGVFIFSEEDDRRRLESGQPDFQGLWTILAAVRPEGAEHLRHEL